MIVTIVMMEWNHLSEAHLHGPPVDHGGADINVKGRVGERHKEGRLGAGGQHPHLDLRVPQNDQSHQSWHVHSWCWSAAPAPQSESASE